MKVSCRRYDKKVSANFNINKHERATENGTKNQKVEKPICYDPFNSFHVTSLFRYPLKTSGNQRFSDFFRGY